MNVLFPLFLLQHRPDLSPAAHPHAVQIDIDCLVPFLDAVLCRQGRRSSNASVVHSKIDPAKPTNRFSHRFIY